MPKGVPLADWKVRERRGLPSMTRAMMTALKQLQAAKENDWPFIHLPDVHINTLRALVRNDWIFESQGLDGVRYKITERGMKALKVYEPVVRRGDDICPNCGERPKRFYKTGRKSPYCVECERDLEHRERAHGLTNGDTERMCSRCGKRKRHKYPGGTYSTYCTKCNRKLKLRGKRKRISKKLEAILTGAAQPPKCGKCGQPCHYTEKSLYDLCREHWLEYLRQYNDKRRPNSRAAKSRRNA